jgi:hypothetical protein
MTAIIVFICISYPFVFFPDFAALIFLASLLTSISFYIISKKFIINKIICLSKESLLVIQKEIPNQLENFIKTIKMTPNPNIRSLSNKQAKEEIISIFANLTYKNSRIEKFETNSKIWLTELVQCHQDGLLKNVYYLETKYETLIQDFLQEVNSFNEIVVY